MPMMAYSNQFVLSVISTQSNRPLREFAENGERTCVLPFNSEYKLRLKNKSYKRTKVKIYIDGMDAMSSGGFFILNSNQTIDIERFVDSLNSGRKFKFISAEDGLRTGEVQDPHHEDNGKITVEFYEEMDLWGTLTTTGTITLTNGTSNVTYGSGDAIGAINTYTNNATSASFNSTNCTPTSSVVYPSARALSSTSTVKSAGVTTQGSQSNQHFHQAQDFPTNSTPTVITIKLRGSEGPKPQVSKSVQVQSPWSATFEGMKVTVYHNGKYFTDSTQSKITLAGKKLKVENTSMNLEVELA
jgi:hypothetical protein